jgi:3-phosphoshikimate 1-carboxyvinyltransferase
MNLLLQTSHSNLQADIAVTQESETNRLLLLQALFPKIISEYL